MQLRKFQYSIEYYHILTFRDHYKSVVAPFFEYDSLEYAVENENTLNESIRLVFPNEHFIMQFRKEACVLLFEGMVGNLKKQNPIVEIFFEIYERTKKIPEFTKTFRNRLICDAVRVVSKEGYNVQDNAEQFLINPFKNILEFNAIVEFEKDNKNYHIELGNYSKADLKKRELSPFKTEENRDLEDGVGLMIQTNIYEKTNAPTFSKFKTLIYDSEQVISDYLNRTDNVSNH